MIVSRTKASLFNLIISIFNTIVGATLGLFVSRLILGTYGSDYNGLNSTIIQIVNMLQILEAGFAISINLALYKPVLNKENEKINSILVSANKVFKKVGFVFLLAGLVVSVVFPLFIKTEIGYLEILLLFVMTVLPTAAKIFFSMKYNCLFNAYQEEYFVQLINIAAQIICYLLSITIALFVLNYLYIRFSYMLVMLLACVAIKTLFNRKHPEANFKDKTVENYKIIGASDVIAQKIASALYGSFPMILISVFISTQIASVYGVYLIVINIIKGLLSAVVSAPSHAFGQIIAERDENKLYKHFLNFNLLNIIFETVFLSTTMVLIIPFISLYTANINDVNYIDKILAIILVATAYVELLHIPSGTIMNVSGYFKQSKYFQIAAATIIIVFGLLGVLFFEIYGVLLAVFLSAVLLCFCEIIFIYKKLFPKKIKYLIIPIVCNIIIFCSLIAAWSFVNIEITSFIKFILWGACVFIANFAITILFNLLAFKKSIMALTSQFLGIFRLKKRD